MSEIMRFLGVAGIVLLTFGLIPYGLTGAFDMWTAVHVTGGAILLACAIGLNFARFRSAVAARGTRQQLQALIGTALFGGLLVTTNIVAVRHPWVHDTTAERIHTLSERSRAVAAALEEEVELLAFLGAGAPERAMLRGLLERFAAAGARVRWRMVDPVQDPDLADRFEIRQEGVLVAVTESGSARQRPDPTFGWTESSVTHLLLKVSRSGPRVIYAVVGHGEARPDDLETPGGMGVLARLLEDASFEVRALVLSAVPAVPEDAAAMIIAGPGEALAPDEVERIRTYVEGAGRVMVLVDAGIEHGLGELLGQYRIVLGNDLVVDPGRVAFLGPRSGFAPLVDDFPVHPVTRGFAGRIALDRARSVSVRAAGPDPNLEASVVARSGEGSWAERNPERAVPGTQIRKDAGDLAGPVPVAVASRAPVGEGEGEARWVVFGDSSLVRNAGIRAFQNRLFVLGAIDWLVGDERLVPEEHRSLRASRLDLSEADYRNLFRLSVLLLPEAIVIVGLGIWWRRRAL